MKKIFLLSVLLLLSLEGFAINVNTNRSPGGEGWKAGVATTDITPEQAMWLCGYASCTDPSTGTLRPLWAKALAVEDGGGNRAVLVTADILGWPKRISDEIRSRLNKKLNLSKSQVLLNSSHTHSGPVLG